MKKTERIEILSTRKQLESLDAKARLLGISRSEYLLFCGLNAQIKCEVGADTFQSEIAILERKLLDGIIIKHQFSEMVDILIDKQKRLKTYV